MTSWRGVAVGAAANATSVWMVRQPDTCCAKATSNTSFEQRLHCTSCTVSRTGCTPTQSMSDAANRGVASAGCASGEAPGSAFGVSHGTSLAHHNDSRSARMSPPEHVCSAVAHSLVAQHRASPNKNAKSAHSPTLHRQPLRNGLAPVTHPREVIGGSNRCGSRHSREPQATPLLCGWLVRRLARC